MELPALRLSGNVKNGLGVMEMKCDILESGVPYYLKGSA
jgi:hypothetical protein